MSRAKSIFMVAGMVISWSLYYAISKIVVARTGSAFMTSYLLRLAALLFLTVLLAVDGHLKGLFSWGKSTWILIAVGVLGFTQDICANLGYAGGNLSTGTALLKTDILMTNLATVILYKKHLYKSDWLGTFIMLLGVFLVLGISIKDLSFNITDLFFILSALALTANAFIVKDAQNAHNVDADTLSYYNNFVVMFLSFIGASASGDLSEISSYINAELVFFAFLGGLCQTGVYFFYYRNLKNMEVWIVKLYILLIPVLSMFIGIFFLGETLTLTKLIGIIVVLLGAVIILIRDKINNPCGLSSINNSEVNL